jgi:hypothetical protein
MHQNLATPIQSFSPEQISRYIGSLGKKIYGEEDETILFDPKNNSPKIVDGCCFHNAHNLTMQIYLIKKRCFIFTE